MLKAAQWFGKAWIKSFFICLILAIVGLVAVASIAFLPYIIVGGLLVGSFLLITK